MTKLEDLFTPEWLEFNAKFQERVDACYNSDEFKAWVNALDDKCKHCPVADGRFSKDDWIRHSSFFACEFRCPRVLVLSYWDEHGIEY